MASYERTDADELTRQTFDRILDVLQHLRLHQLSPKFFVLYAHDSSTSSTKAHQNVVKDYISWFKKANLNVDSDRSPHGNEISSTKAHDGASLNIIQNQICLLPHEWNTLNVDYVLVFYSELLAEYMEEERNFPIEGVTYSQALYNACNKYTDESKVSWETVCGDVYKVQERYYTKMGGKFHHALTELALLKFTNQRRHIKYTIPIILFGDKTWPPERKWKPEYVNIPESQIKLEVESGQEYRLFFKILLQFDILESRRPQIEAFRECFEKCVGLLTQDITCEEYLKKVELSILETLQDLNNKKYWTIEGPINAELPVITDHIRAILDIHSRIDCLSLQRISGQRLSENVNDIDLAVAEQLNSTEKGQEQVVPLHGLFDSITIRGTKIYPKRILILGKPGVGKTTLCKRIMYEYCWHDSLRRKFELVVRISVRELRHSNDLADLLFHEYFQVAQRGRELSKALNDHILGDKIKVLIILDGLDEAQGFSEPKLNLLRKLMERPDIVVTSRYYTDGTPSVDLQLEALGLSMTNVKSYLKNTDIVAADTATDIRLFIDANPPIADMVRLPIFLDILCYCWDRYQRQEGLLIVPSNNGTDGQSLTTTTLYQAVVRTLFQKDIPSLGKIDHGEPVNDETVKAIRDITRLERVVHFEIQLLEEIALDLFKSDRFEFSNTDIAKAIQRLEAKGPQLPLSLDKNLSKLSLIRSHSTENFQRYSFVHLTFQEFLFAQYIARDQTRLETYLRSHKYDRKYETIWRFVPGLLVDPKDINCFFDLLDQEPRDIMGRHHIHLIMYGLNECQHRIESSRQDKIFQKLADWQRIERFIGTDVAFPECIIAKQLFSDSSTTVKPGALSEYLLDTIRSRSTVSEDFMLRILQSDANFDYPQGNHRELSKGTISVLMEQVRKRGEKANTAAYMLGQQLYLPSATLKELEGWLRLGDEYLYNKAVHIFSQQSNLPKEIINIALDELTNDPTFFTGSYMIRNCQNLHREAIAKLVNLFRRAVQENAKVPTYGVVLILQRQILQSDNVAELETVLRRSMRNKEKFESLISRTIDVFLRNKNIPINILKLFVQLLKPTQGGESISSQAAIAFQNQSHLSAEVIQDLREIFNDHPWETISALIGRVTLLNEALPFVMKQITLGVVSAKYVNITIKSLQGQSDLSEDIMTWLIRNIPKSRWKTRFLISQLISQQKYLSDEVVSTCLEPDNLDRIIHRRPEFIRPFLTRIEMHGENIPTEAVIALGEHDLDVESINRLVALLAVKPASKLAASKSRAAATVLVKQNQLSTETILTLFEIINQSKDEYLLWKLWWDQSIELFYSHLETICNLGEKFILDFVIQRLLRGSKNGISSPAWIDGETISFYRPDGKLVSLRLRDQHCFRTKFRKAQIRAGFPEWARIPLSRTTWSLRNVAMSCR